LIPGTVNEQITNRRRKSTTSRIIRSVERVFLEKKLNNRTGGLLITFVAVGMGYLLAKDMLLGIGVFGLVLGLSVTIACLLSSETGFYINFAYCFLVYQASRMFFRDGLQVGVITDVLIGSTLFSFFIKGDSLKKSMNQFIQSPIVLLILLNFFYGALEIFNPEGHSFEAWVQAIRRSFETFIYLFIAFQILRDKERIRKFIRMLFIFCVLVALYGCIQQWHGLFDFERAWVMADELRFGLIFINGDFRKFSTFNDPTAFGSMMAACSVFFTILALNQRDKRIKRTLLAGVILMLLAMAYSGTRTANVMLMAGFGMFILLTINKKSTRVFAMVAVVLFAAVLYVPVYDNPTINRFRSSFLGSQDESFNVRELSRNYIRPYMLSHPFGGGLGTTGNLGLTLNPGHFLAGFQTDSGYLQMALEIGWLGLAIICTLFFLVLKGGAACYFKSSDEEMKTVYAAGTCGIFCFYIGMFAQNTLGHITDMAYYFPVIAIILRFKYYDNQANTNNPEP
jgi:putative inorganic carbon (HCO3(-)) transporter